ncbi:MAG TPA: secretin N-terminal domain-containing protein, partial [Ferruginibacter sp.]|nr:secretin N-terminal domain-containing protein [Ferruginibacter sp.]
MRNKGWGLKIVGIIFLVGFLQTISYCQTKDDRFKVLEKRLKDLSTTEPGLNEKTDLSVSDGTLQGFLRGLASTNNLNLNIDPSLTQHVNNYFSNETVANVLLYLAHQYNLDFTFIGSIISIAPYKDPLANLPPPPKNINISYNSFTQNVSYDLQDDTLLNVAKKITQLTNRNVVILPQLYTKRVTGYVQNLPLQNALEKLAITNSFKINTTSDSAIILEPLESDEEIVTKEKGLSNANFSIKKVNKDGSSSASSIEVNNDDNGKKIITLNVINAPIKDVIKNIAGQAGISYFEYSDIEGNTTANVKGMAFDQVLGDILHDTKYTYNIDKGVYMIGERANEGLRSVKLIQLQYRSVDSLIQFIPEDLRQGVEIKEFKELNSFLLSGSEPQIEEIASVIKQLDKVVPMITLEVIILDVNKGKSITTGISAGTSDSTVTPGGSILGGGGLNYTLGNKDINQFLSNIGVNNVFNLGRVTPSFYITLQALENRTNINERQTPKLSTLNGHTANLSIG